MASSTAKKFCTRCCTVAEPAARVADPRGAVTGLVTAGVVAYMFRRQGAWWLPLALVVPALLTLFRRVPHCPACGSRELVPLDTPAARRWLERAEAEADAALRAMN